MQETFKIKNATGLHARPAAELIKITSKFPCSVSLVKGDKKANAKSIISVLSLGISQNEEVMLVTVGDQEKEALEAVVTFLESLEN